MAKQGKETCKQLKEIRRKIAEENDIALEVSECTFEGECRGTCQRCEAEVRYLERELSHRIAAGKVVVVAGIAAATSAVTSCNSSKHDSISPTTTSDILFGEIAPDGWLDTHTTPSIQNEDAIYIIPETDPEFPGGAAALRRYLAENVRYPKLAQENDITGKVYVTFVIEKDGSVSNVKILRDIGGGCGEEVVRAVESMPKWTPGKQNGQAVRTQFNIPVKFPPSENK